MKQGRTISEMAMELERQQNEKKDYLADTSAIEMKQDPWGVLTLDGLNGEPVGITDNCHDQIGQRVGIPKRYYDKMRNESAPLLAHNVNHWFKNSPEKRMVRTLDSRARAFLSDRYRPLDNLDLAEAVLPKIVDMKCEIASCELTDKRMYIKAITKRVELEVRKGDVVQAGVVISNSEVGAGSVKVTPLVYRLVCQNGLIANDHGLRKYHIGRSFGADDVSELFRDETREQDDKAFFMKVRDVVAGALDQAVFQKIVSRMIEATENPIDKDPVKVIEVVQKRFSLTDDERGSVLTHLIKDGDLTQYGLMNAVTRTAQDVDSYERATELETLGSQVLELPKREWASLAMAS